MNLKAFLFCSASAVLLGACETTYSQDESAATTNAVIAESLAAEGGGNWPPAGCKTPTELVQFLNANPNYSPSYYFGLYSGGENMLENGNSFYLGWNYGENVQPPNSPFSVAPTAQGTGVMIRWNISDRYKDPQSGNFAPKTVSDHYYWDYDHAEMAASADGVYAYDALAVNLCTNNPQTGAICEQPLFGEAAWQADARTPGFELCPPIILKSDPDSIYVWDQNDNNIIQTYEYSLAMILKLPPTNGNQIKNGLRIIIDPRVTNGGVGN